MRPGRPTKLTPALQAKVVEAIRAGNYIETAAAYAGVSKVTLYDWMRRGNEQKSGRFREFLNAVEKALGDSEARDVALIGKAAGEDWKAAAWRLERRFPDRWGRREKHELSGPKGGPVEVVSLAHLSDEELDQVERALSRGVPPDGQG